MHFYIITTHLDDLKGLTLGPRTFSSTTLPPALDVMTHIKGLWMGMFLALDNIHLCAVESWQYQRRQSREVCRKIYGSSALIINSRVQNTSYLCYYDQNVQKMMFNVYVSQGKTFKCCTRRSCYYGCQLYVSTPNMSLPNWLTPASFNLVLVQRDGSCQLLHRYVNSIPRLLACGLVWTGMVVYYRSSDMQIYCRRNITSAHSLADALLLSRRIDLICFLNMCAGGEIVTIHGCFSYIDFYGYYDFNWRFPHFYFHCNIARISFQLRLQWRYTLAQCCKMVIPSPKHTEISTVI
jgi:hypothetical protein